MALLGYPSTHWASLGILHDIVEKLVDSDDASGCSVGAVPETTAARVTGVGAEGDDHPAAETSTVTDDSDCGTVWRSSMAPHLCFRWLRSWAVQDGVMMSKKDVQALVIMGDACSLLALLKPEVAAVL